MPIHITGDDAADQVLTDDPFALLLGMLLDQQYPMDNRVCNGVRPVTSVSGLTVHLGLAPRAR